MAEPPEDRRPPRPIVPDPDASLSPRARQPDPPRLWPLWLLFLLLIAAGAGLAWAGWQERARLQAELARVSGELSNVHARFDADEGRGEALAALEERLDELADLEGEIDAALERRLSTVGGELEAALDERIAPLEEALPRQRARLAALAEQAETRDATLAATRTSLDALERAGEEGRAALGERLTSLEQGREALNERVATLGERVQALAARLTPLEGQVEDAVGSRDDERQRMDALERKLQEMGTELRELRQSQLALNAQLEALRQ